MNGGTRFEPLPPATWPRRPRAGWAAVAACVVAGLFSCQSRIALAQRSAYSLSVATEVPTAAQDGETARASPLVHVRARSQLEYELHRVVGQYRGSLSRGGEPHYYQTHRVCAGACGVQVDNTNDSDWVVRSPSDMTSRPFRLPHGAKEVEIVARGGRSSLMYTGIGLGIAAVVSTAAGVALLFEEHPRYARRVPVSALISAAVFAATGATLFLVSRLRVRVHRR